MKYTLSQFHKLREHDKYPILSLILAVCLLLPILSFFPPFYPLWVTITLSFNQIFPALLIISIFLSLFFLKRHETGKESLSPKILFLSALLSIGMAGIWWIICQVLISPSNWYLNIFEVYGGAKAGGVLRGILKCICLAVSVIGINGLLKSRPGNRYWQAVYVLSLTVVLFIVSVLVFLTTADTSAAGWQQSYLRYFITISIMGLVGTGVFLVHF